MAEENQFSLLRQRRFAPFFWTQFLGAFNDNLFKSAVITLFTFHAAGWSSLNTVTLVNLCAGMFILPFFLFSALAGQLAEKFEKSRLIRAIKLLEIAIMLLGGLSLYLHSMAMLLTVLFFMGTQSTLFGPVKYSILPQILKDEELMGGNGLVEMGTFVAILLGTTAGGVLIGLGETGLLLVALGVLLVGLAGWGVSTRIPAVGVVAVGLPMRWNLVKETYRILGYATERRDVFHSIMGISWFWFYGATLLAQLPVLTEEVLGGNEHVNTLLLALFSVGVGTGSLLCERLSGGKVELGLVPMGAFGLTVFALDFAWVSAGAAPLEARMGLTAFLALWGSWHLLFDVVMIGMFGGFFIVPLYALVQQRSAAEHRSRVIAANNIYNALFMVTSALLAAGLVHLGVTLPQLIFLLGVVNTFVALYIFFVVPEYPVRFLVWILVHSVYRLTTRGLQHLPKKEAAILVCNQVSWVDTLIIGAACPRVPRFVVPIALCQRPVLGYVLRTLGAIPYQSELPREAIEQALAAGDWVCLFPEGSVTQDGEIQPFQTEYEALLTQTSIPLIPLALCGLWGSLFSQGKKRFPYHFGAKIEVVVGTPSTLPLSLLAWQKALQALRGDRV